MWLVVGVIRERQTDPAARDGFAWTDRLAGHWITRTFLYLQRAGTALSRLGAAVRPLTIGVEMFELSSRLVTPESRIRRGLTSESIQSPYEPSPARA
jgi:hypothetical protein